MLQPQGTLGNVPPQLLVGPGLVTLDLGGFRNLQTPWLGRALAAPVANRDVQRAQSDELRPASTHRVRRKLADEASLANAGRITTTTTSARQIQLAAKLLW